MSIYVLRPDEKELLAEEEPTLRLRKYAPEQGARREPLEAAARAFQDFLQSHVGERGPQVEAWRSSFPGYAEHAQLFLDLHRHDPLAAERLAAAMINMPTAGMEIMGFHLLSELGRGSFARVFLAEQTDLARRHVVLKLGADIWGEAQTLAQLRHPNIIPVYSVHHSEPFQAVCMPYKGSVTLQDILREVRQRDALPTTGKYLLQAYESALSSRQGLSSGPAATECVPEPANVQPAPALEPTDDSRRKILVQLSYVEAIVGLGAELADGLTHAHEHGIVHHDLKPANVLLTDEGQPLLLDFNVAEDTKLQAGATVAWVAGTLPYMAPEQLAVIQGAAVTIDARSDLYAFGIVMFELLTGRFPFRHQRSLTQSSLEMMCAERNGPLPRLRCWNPAVSPALEAIVRHCLEPDPARRYQTARQLQEDLECQRTHRPLLHTPEPSLKERLSKWSRRHPRFLAVNLVTAIAAVLIIGLSALVVTREEQVAQLKEQEQQRLKNEDLRRTALARQQNFQEDLKTVQYLLYTRAMEPEQRAQGVAVGFRLLEEYRVQEEASWQQLPLVEALSDGDRQRLRADMGELLLVLARAVLWQPDGEKDAAAKALQLNTRAEACDTRLTLSPVLWQQRGELFGLLGREVQAAQCRKHAEDGLMLTSQDQFLLASDHLAAGRLDEALALLQKTVWMDPQHFWAWFVLGNCYDRIGRDGRAEACYTAAIALRPRFAWGHFNRGLVYLRLQEHSLARADFDKAIELRPELAEAYLNRALAHQALKNYGAAEADLSRALERGITQSRVYLLRARVREKLGDKEGAQQDHAEAERRPPTDEKSLLARGFANLNKDPKAALADFEEALRLNPRSALGLQNKAHVLAEKMGRNQEALEALNKAVELYPKSTQARGGRGVVLARLGQRALAIRDAEETLAQDSSPARVYQVACIYALTAANNPEDRLQAVRLLSTALQKGYGFPLVETDPDLAPLRNQPDFRRLVEAARALHTPPLTANKS